VVSCLCDDGSMAKIKFLRIFRSFIVGLPNPETLFAQKKSRKQQFGNFIVDLVDHTWWYISSTHIMVVQCITHMCIDIWVFVNRNLTRSFYYRYINPSLSEWHAIIMNSVESQYRLRREKFLSRFLFILGLFYKTNFFPKYIHHILFSLYSIKYFIKLSYPFHSLIHITAILYQRWLIKEVYWKVVSLVPSLLSLMLNHF